MRYEMLGGLLPAGSVESVQDRVRRRLRGLDASEARMAALLHLVRTEVDYLFVAERAEPYRPAPPAVVLERGWGDCKDKAFLLIAALRAAGIEAHPLLVTLKAGTQVDPRFPSLSPFDHVLVAARDGGALYFLEPSQPLGGLHWLDPALQDRNALLVDGAASHLVRTPLAAGAERREMSLSLRLEPGGQASGTAMLRLEGAAALAVLDALGHPATERMDGDGTDGTDGNEAVPAHQVAQRLDPLLQELLAAAGLSFEPIEWRRKTGARPHIEIAGAVYAEGLTVPAGSPSFLLLPSPFGLARIHPIRKREVLPLELGTTRTVWRVRLPEGCRCDETSIVAENELGSFRQEVSVEAQSEAASEIVVERRMELLLPRIGQARIPAANELVTAAQRAHHVAIQCPDATAVRGQEM